MGALTNIRKSILLLCLFVAGVQSAWAERGWINRYITTQTVTMGAVVYQVCYRYAKRAMVKDTYAGIETGGYIELPDTLPSSISYFASVIGINGSSEVTIQDSIKVGTMYYPVKYIGRHFEQHLETTLEDYIYHGDYYDESLMTTTAYNYTVIETPVPITTSTTRLTVKPSVEMECLKAAACRSAMFEKDVVIKDTLNLDMATEIMFEGATTINAEGKLFCKNVSELRFNQFTHLGLICCGNGNKLTDIYYQVNLPDYAGSFSNYFDGLNSALVSAHLAGKTEQECQQIHNSWAVYSDFAYVVPYDPNNDTPDYKMAKVTFTLQGNYPRDADIDFHTAYLRCNNLVVHGGESGTLQVEKGDYVNWSLHAPSTPYNVFATSKYYVNGVLIQEGPDAVGNIQDDVNILVVMEPDCYFVPVTNLSAPGTHSLYWMDTSNTEHEIPPQTTYSVPVKHYGTSGTLIYGMEGDHDDYTLRGYWYNGTDYMDNNDTSTGGVWFQDELWQGDGDYRLQFWLLPTAERQDRQVLIGLSDGVPTSDRLTIKAVQGEGGSFVMCYTYDGVTQNKRYTQPIAGGDLLASVEKSKLGNNFTLKVIPDKGRKLYGLYINDVYRNPAKPSSTSGDTLVWELGNLAKLYDVYRFNMVYSDLYDYTKRKVHFKTTGTPKGFAIMELDDVKAGRYIARYSRQAFPLELNRSLDVGSEYHFKFMGTDEGFNVKRVTINGEEVQLTQDPSNSYTKVSPDRTLGSFDDVVVIEFEEENSGDINGDGSVTIADVTKLVNKILGKE